MRDLRAAKSSSLHAGPLRILSRMKDGVGEGCDGEKRQSTVGVIIHFLIRDKC
jgi:hypothetical protein